VAGSAFRRSPGRRRAAGSACTAEENEAKLVGEARAAGGPHGRPDVVARFWGGVHGSVGESAASVARCRRRSRSRSTARRSRSSMSLCHRRLPSVSAWVLKFAEFWRFPIICFRLTTLTAIRRRSSPVGLARGLHAELSGGPQAIRATTAPRNTDHLTA
jgi:hypothetical protein